jgi:hypothetical protein
MPDSPHMAAATADAADRSTTNFGPAIATGQTILARPFAPRGAMTSERLEAVSSATWSERKSLSGGEERFNCRGGQSHSVV